MSFQESIHWISGSSAPKKLMIFLFLVVASLTIFMVLGIILAVPFWGMEVATFLNNADYSNPSYLAFIKYFQIVSQLGIFIIPTILFALLSGEGLTKYLRLQVRPTWIPLALTLLISIFCLPLINGISELNQMMKLPAFMHGMETWMKQTEDSAEILTKAFLGTTSIWGLLLNILMIVLIPAIGEEFLFRGVLQRVFSEWFKNIHLAVFVSAFLFSAMHMQFFGFLPRLMLGAFLGYCYAWTGNLWVPIAAHFLNNFLAVMAAFFFQQGLSESNYNNLGEAPGIWAYFLSGALTLILLIMLYKFSKAKASVQITEW
ncbi:MAG: CPBP family intramembrane glutamic endopeptidase [Bacteroidota bacterium]